MRWLMAVKTRRNARRRSSSLPFAALGSSIAPVQAFALTREDRAVPVAPSRTR